MSTTTGLGVNNTIYYSHGDLTSRCPGCFKENTSKLGVLTIDGTPRDVNKCDNCNRLFSAMDGGIRSLAEEAKIKYGTENIGFTITSNGTSTITSNGYNLPNNINIASTPNDYKFDQMNSNLININATINTLLFTIQNIMQQNQDLINKLAADPLINIRKNVSDFNLV